MVPEVCFILIFKYMTVLEVLAANNDVTTQYALSNRLDYYQLQFCYFSHSFVFDRS